MCNLLSGPAQFSSPNLIIYNSIFFGGLDHVFKKDKGPIE